MDKKIFDQAVHDRSKGKVALFLSGGVDSGMIAHSMAQQAIFPELILSSKLGILQSEDTRIALRRARILFGYDSDHVCISIGHGSLENSAAEIIGFAGYVLKTMVEVCLMTFPLLREAKDRGCDAVLTGMAAEVLWGTGRELSIAARGGQVAWTDARLKGLLWSIKGFPAMAVRVCRSKAKSLGLEWRDPFEDMAVTEMFMRTDVKEFKAQGEQKLAAFKMYPALTAKTGNMQSVAGAREAMLRIAEVNGYKSAIAYYNAIARNLGIQPKGDIATLKRWDSEVDEIRLTQSLALAKKLKEEGLTTVDSLPTEWFGE